MILIKMLLGSMIGSIIGIALVLMIADIIEGDGDD